MQFLIVFGGDFSGTSGTISSPWYDQSKTFSWAPAAVFGRFASPTGVSMNTNLTEEYEPRRTYAPAYMGEEAWWRITVPSGFFVQISFDDFSIPTMAWLSRRRQCWVMFQLEVKLALYCMLNIAYNFFHGFIFKVYDGYCNYQSGNQNLECTLARTLCGIDIPQPWISLSNMASLRLVAKLNQISPKFLLQWTAVPSSRPNITTKGQSTKQILI